MPESQSLLELKLYKHKNQMNFILPVPSLEHMALVKIAISIWSSDNVRYQIRNHIIYQKNIWKDVEEIVAGKASELSLPALLKEKIFYVIGPVGLQIHSWLKFHKKGIIGTAELPAILFWTSHGTINSKRTVEVLVKDETFDVQHRFALACSYCLVDDILDLRSIYIPSLDNTSDHEFAISFWCTYLEQTDERRRTQTILDNLKSFAKFGNEIAIRYFYLKLSTQITGELRLQIAKVVARLVRFERILGGYLEQYSATLYFLMSTMNVEQQAEIFKSHTYEVLKGLLLWPRQSLFLETAKDKWSFLSKESYYALLNNIVDGMNCQRNYLGELFKEFWLLAPETYKQFVTNRDDFGLLLLELCIIKDQKNIELILKDLSISARKKFIFSKVGGDFYSYLARRGMWNAVEYIIQECIQTQEEMIKFKSRLLKPHHMTLNFFMD